VRCATDDEHPTAACFQSGSFKLQLRSGVAAPNFRLRSTPTRVNGHDYEAGFLIVRVEGRDVGFNDVARLVATVDAANIRLRCSFNKVWSW